MKDGALYELPGGWVRTYLDDISAKITDGEHIRPIITSMGMPFLSAKDVRTEGIIFNNSFCVGEDDAKKFRIKCNPELGDILIVSRGATVGRSCMVNTKRKFCLLGSVILIKLHSTVSNKFISYVIKSAEIQTQLTGLCGSTAQQAIYLRDIKKIYVPLPPLPEQRAIVSKIEQLFSDLDNGIENFKKAQEQLKIYRQAVLKKAFEGELTKKWREEQTDLPSADDLLQLIKGEREKYYQIQLDEWKTAVKDGEDGGKEGKKTGKPKKSKELPPLTDKELGELMELPDNWCWTHLGDLTDLSAGHAFKKSEYSKDGIKLFQIANVTFGKTNWDKIEYLPKSYMEKWPKLVLKEGDILLALNRPLLQRKLKICRLGKKDLPAILYQRVGRFDFYFSGMENYILNFMQGIFFISAFEKELQGVNIPFINKDKLLSKHVPICSIQEQHQIVQEIETRLSICDNMEKTIAESLQKAESLRQSILKKAFEGKLLNEKELEEVRNAPDWEPAEKLLERIKAEKTNTKAKKKGKK